MASIGTNRNADAKKSVRSYTVYYRNTDAHSAEKTFSVAKHGSAKAASAAAEAFKRDLADAPIVDNRTGKQLFTDAVLTLLLLSASPTA